MGRKVETTVTCDNCGKDIRFDGGSNMWNIEVSAISREWGTDMRHLVLTYPPLKEPLIFCNMQCLYEWLKRKYGEVEDG